MNNKSIKKLTKSIELIPLEEDNFDDFCKKTFDFFASDKTRFEHYFSPIYDSDFARKYALYKRNPKWNSLEDLNFDRINIKKDSLIVTFNENWSFMTELLGQYYPISFGFDSDKAMYVVRQDENGIPKYPWEELLLRRD